MRYVAHMADGPELIVVVITIPFLVGYFANIWALVQAIRKYTKEDYLAINKDRGGQIGLHVVGIFVQLIGIIMGGLWIFGRRKQLEESFKRRTGA